MKTIEITWEYPDFNWAFREAHKKAKEQFEEEHDYSPYEIKIKLLNITMVMNDKYYKPEYTFTFEVL